MTAASPAVRATMATTTPPAGLPDGALAWKVEGHPSRREPLADGPWLAEPDKVQWVDPATGLDCLIVRQQLGALCGYVGVPAGHPDHGSGYDDLEPWPEVHGGLTYADSCTNEGAEGQPSPGICHVPAPGRPHDVWWFGFDCGHAFDVIPGYPHWNQGHAVYRTVEYVAVECTSLAQWLAERSAAGVA